MVKRVENVSSPNCVVYFFILNEKYNAMLIIPMGPK